MKDFSHLNTVELKALADAVGTKIALNHATIRRCENIHPAEADTLGRKLSAQISNSVLVRMNEDIHVAVENRKRLING